MKIAKLSYYNNNNNNNQEIGKLKNDNSNNLVTKLFIFKHNNYIFKFS
jgi:hypothetical protein